MLIVIVQYSIAQERCSRKHGKMTSERCRIYVMGITHGNKGTVYQIVNTMAADGLRTQNPRFSAAVVSSYFLLSLRTGGFFSQSFKLFLQGLGQTYDCPIASHANLNIVSEFIICSTRVFCITTPLQITINFCVYSMKHTVYMYLHKCQGYLN